MKPDKYFYREGNWYHFGLPYTTQITFYLSDVLKCKLNNANKEWYVEATITNIQRIKQFIEKEGLVEGRFTPPSDIELRPHRDEYTEEEIGMMSRTMGLNKNPRPYQVEAITYQINHGNSICGLGCGCGKTLTEIYYAEICGEFPVLVICPSTVKAGWKREWNEINPNRTISIIDATDKEHDFSADVIVINYEYLYARGEKAKKKGIQLRFDKEFKKKKFQLAIIDEIHFCKSGDAMRSKAVKKIVSKIPVAQGLSGTMVQSRPKELISILKILGRFTDLFPDLQFYYDRYCNRKMTFFGQNIDGHSNTEELNKVLSHYCYISKEKRDILKDLPPITDTYVECDFKNMREYRKAENDLISYLSGIDSERAESAMGAQSLVLLSVLKEISLNGKMDFIVKFLQEWAEANADSKMLVFGIRKEPLKRLHEEFMKFSVIITGDDNLQSKQKKIEEFSDKQFLFANIQTIGTGVDGLQKVCDTMAFIEYPDTPDMMEQAKSRLERSGQKNNITVLHLMCSETIDKMQWDMLQKKAMVADSINKGSFEGTEFKDFNQCIINRIRKKSDD